MEVKNQIKEVNQTLREMAIGFKGIDIAIKSGVKQSNISGWMRGIDVGIDSLSKIANALGRKITIKLEQDWPTEEEVSND